MRLNAFCVVFLFLHYTVSGQSQTGTSMPSNDEIFELLAKAEEKVSAFESGLKSIKTDLDKADPKSSPKYLDAATAAHKIIKDIRKNGPSAYALVGLVTTLDDLSLDAATASITLLLFQIKSGQTENSGLWFLVPLLTSKNDCTDISELIMHATLRLIRTEEDILDKLSRTK